MYNPFCLPIRIKIYKRDVKFWTEESCLAWVKSKWRPRFTTSGASFSASHGSLALRSQTAYWVVRGFPETVSLHPGPALYLSLPDGQKGTASCPRTRWSTQFRRGRGWGALCLRQGNIHWDGPCRSRWPWPTWGIWVWALPLFYFWSMQLEEKHAILQRWSRKDGDSLHLCSH